MNIPWNKVGNISDFPEDLGSCVKLHDRQIAIFRIPTPTKTEESQQWYAVQNMNPINQRMVLSRGIVGCTEEGHKVACPLHKHNFSLKDGRHLGEDDSISLETYPIKVVNEEVFLKLES